MRPHPPHMSMFANNALLGSGVRVRIREQKIKSTTKPLMANLDITDIHYKMTPGYLNTASTGNGHTQSRWCMYVLHQHMETSQGSNPRGKLLAEGTIWKVGLGV